MTNRYK